jgi:hypothetical protein
MTAQSMLVRYYSDHGPRRGPLQPNDVTGPIPVLDRPGRAGKVIGSAHPSGWITAGNGPALLWTLRIGGRTLKGLWICDGRRFNPL